VLLPDGRIAAKRSVEPGMPRACCKVLQGAQAIMKIDRQNRQFTPEYHPACGMPCQPFFHGTGSTPSGAGGHGGSRWRVPTSWTISAIHLQGQQDHPAIRELKSAEIQWPKSQAPP